MKLNENSKPFPYYAFDWDDNILMMPTEIIVLDSEGMEVGISTSDFAVFRTKVGNEHFDYNGHEIVGYAKDPYRNFLDDPNPNIFFEDAMKALKSKSYGPSWSDFIECLTNGSIFAIITARGHEDNSIRVVIEYIIDGILTSDQKNLMYNNLKKYKYLFDRTENFDMYFNGKLTDHELCKAYLNNCEFVGVSSPSRNAGSHTSSSPEIAKKKALIDFKSKVNRFAGNIGGKATVGFSDDDTKTIGQIKNLIQDLDNEKFPNVLQTTIKDTNNPEKIKKVVYESKVIKHFKEFISESEDKGMYVDKSTEKVDKTSTPDSKGSSTKEIATMGNSKGKKKKKK